MLAQAIERTYWLDRVGEKVMKSPRMARLGPSVCSLRILGHCFGGIGEGAGLLNRVGLQRFKELFHRLRGWSPRKVGHREGFRESH